MRLLLSFHFISFHFIFFISSFPSIDSKRTNERMESTIHENCPPFRNRKRCDSMRCKARNNCINNKKNKWFQLGNSSIVHSYRVNANCNFNGININIGYYSNIAISKVFLWLKVHRYNTMVCFFVNTRIFFWWNWQIEGKMDAIWFCYVTSCWLKTTDSIHNHVFVAVYLLFTRFSMTITSCRHFSFFWISWRAPQKSYLGKCVINCSEFLCICSMKEIVWISFHWRENGCIALIFGQLNHSSCG